MFSYERDASKVALVHLAARLIHGGFQAARYAVRDEHLKQFGTIEVDRDAFHKLLDKALEAEGDFPSLDPQTPPETILSIIEAAQTARNR